jgi:hypothetical protein
LTVDKPMGMIEIIGVWCADFGKEKTKPLDPRSPRLPD